MILGDELPWKNIDVGMDTEFLKKEYKKALNGELPHGVKNLAATNAVHVMNHYLNFSNS